MLNTRALLSFCILLFFATGSYSLYRMFMGDYYITQAKEIEKGKDWNTAIGAYRKAIEYAPGNPGYHLLFGEFYLRFAKAANDRALKQMLFERAWHELEAAKKRSPRDACIYLALAQTSEVYPVESVRYSTGAMSHLSSAKANAMLINPTNSTNVTKQTSSTELYYKHALSLYPNSSQYRYLLARYYKRAGKPDKALRQLETMITLNPHTDRYIRRNPFWQLPGIDKAAENGLRQALKNRFTRNHAASILASRMAEKQKWLEAASVYHQTMPEGVFADRSTYDLRMGRYLLRGGKEKEAAAYFLRGVGAAPDRAAVIRRFTGDYKKAGKFDALFALLDELKNQHPEVAEIDLYWAQLLYEKKDYQGALSHLNCFLKGKETAEANYWMAMTCAKLEKPYRAETYIKQAIKWAPETAPYRHFYAGLLYKAWRFAEALKEADAAVQASHNKNPWYLDRKAWILYRMKHYKEAMETWQLAAHLKPGHKAFRRNIDMAAKAIALLRREHDA
ncbi:MAG: hypothetical protein DRH17_08760 [Deltaproteobacteria bacterium]|mgnify:CR=1 FL=1|nr:MAG: hypothetical protein DRH17_08760 [Deltaproteobacteria bacterium]